jgi:hypothetical protein
MNITDYEYGVNVFIFESYIRLAGIRLRERVTAGPTVIRIRF